ERIGHSLAGDERPGHDAPRAHVHIARRARDDRDVHLGILRHRRSRIALAHANTGHPHAFLLPDGGDFERLAASDPPLGMDERAPTTSTRSWNPGRDL